MDPSKRIILKNLPDGVTKREIAELVKNRTGAQVHSIDLGLMPDRNFINHNSNSNKKKKADSSDSDSDSEEEKKVKMTNRRFGFFSCEGAKNVLETLKNSPVVLRDCVIVAEAAKPHYKFVLAENKRKREEQERLEAAEAQRRQAEERKFFLLKHPKGEMRYTLAVRDTKRVKLEDYSDEEDGNDHHNDNTNNDDDDAGTTAGHYENEEERGDEGTEAVLGDTDAAEALRKKFIITEKDAQPPKSWYHYKQKYAKVSQEIANKSREAANCAYPQHRTHQHNNNSINSHSGGGTKKTRLEGRHDDKHNNNNKSRFGKEKKAPGKFGKANKGKPDEKKTAAVSGIVAPAENTKKEDSVSKEKKKLSGLQAKLDALKAKLKK